MTDSNWHIFENNDYKVYIIKNEKSLADLEANDFLCQSDILKYKTFGSTKRKIEWLATRWYLSQIIGSKAIIEYSKFGKPRLINDSRKIGISHSENYIALIISDKYNVAIDIEKRSERILRLQSQFITPNENWQGKSNLSLIDFATTIWCAKETAYKLHETNDINMLSDIIIKPTEQSNLLAKIDKVDKSYELKYQLLDNFAIVWAVEKI